MSSKGLCHSSQLGNKNKIEEVYDKVTTRIAKQNKTIFFYLHVRTLDRKWEYHCCSPKCVSIYKKNLINECEIMTITDFRCETVDHEWISARCSTQIFHHTVLKLASRLPWSNVKNPDQRAILLSKATPRELNSLA